MSRYDAVVYDLDGTLVELDVDWDAVRTDVVSVYDSSGYEPPSRSLWDLLEAAASYDLHDDVTETIAAHEREGARSSRRLEYADRALDQSVPVGVCSLNSESACHLALEEHDLTAAVDVVVGRDTVETWKPDPEPLLWAVDELDATPSSALFVGDTVRDERTAKRAGTDFTYVGGATTHWRARLRGWLGTTLG